MRSFQQTLALLLALLVCAFATDAPSSADEYSTLIVTSTVYRVNTITVSGSATLQTASASGGAAYPTGGAYAASGASNGSHASSTGPVVKPSSPPFTGAAEALGANALLAGFAAGLGLLVL